MFKEKFLSLFKIIWPWAIVFIIFMGLRYTGMLSGVSHVANKALLLTGFLDVEIKPALNTEFNYAFTIQDLDRKSINFNEYKGKVVFLNIWATWCGPCRAEMNSIQSLYSKLNKKDIQFIMLSVDQSGQEQKVKNYIASKQFTFPVFMPYNVLPPQLQVPSIPTTLIIGRDGKILLKEVGATNFDTHEFKEYLEGLASK